MRPCTEAAHSRLAIQARPTLPIRTSVRDGERCTCGLRLGLEHHGGSVREP